MRNTILGLADQRQAVSLLTAFSIWGQSEIRLSFSISKKSRKGITLCREIHGRNNERS